MLADFFLKNADMYKNKMWKPLSQLPAPATHQGTHTFRSVLCLFADLFLCI